MSYLVVDCQGCGTPRVAEANNETAECHRCGSTIRFDDARVHARTDSLAEAQDAVGQVNAQKAGGELLRADEGPGPSPPTDDDEADPGPRDEIDRALVQAREVSSERMQIQLAAEGLTDELGTFGEEDWLKALQRIDIDEPRAREHLRRLSQASVVAEPEHGTFRYVD